MPITKLSTPNTPPKFTHIVHIADVHIRLTRRHDEYREVFNRLYDDISSTPKTTAIFIVGDLVNSKLDLSPECVDLAADFLNECANLRPTVLITGNHDTNLSNRSRMDSLSPIVDALKHPNLFYLTTSGLYGLGNICINNYSVFDEPEKYLPGKDIPAIYRNQYEHFIATYHGTVNGASTDLGFTLTNPSITVNTFDNHDLALLGDIHLAQNLQVYDESENKPYIRYCGSLIQQKHDEPLKGHGYSFWNLEHKDYTHVEVPNDYGFFTVTMENGLITNDLSNLPKKTHLKFKKKNTTESEVNSALVNIRQLTEVIEPTVIEKEKSDSVLARIPSPTGNIALGKIEDINYQTKILVDYLKNRVKIADDLFIHDVVQINNEMNNLIKKDEFARNIRWVPIRFEWSNMFSYGEDNVIDFTKAKDLIGIFAANRSGKSSIFSALTFCLFDKCERDSKAVNVLNTKKDKFSCKFTFEIDGKRFFIKRDGEADKKRKVKVNVRFWTIENGEEKDLNGEQRFSTNDIIRQYLGTYEDFILTALSVQNGKNTMSVIDMGDTDRKELFSQFMGLNIFDKLHTAANERLRERLVTLKMYRSEDYEKKQAEYTALLEQAETLAESYKETLGHIEREKNTIQQQILETTKQLISLDVKIPLISVSLVELEKAKITLESVNSNITKEELALDVVTKSIEEIEKEIAELEEKKVTELYEKYNNLLMTVREINREREQLKSNYAHYLRIFEKAKDIDYDPNCEFCVKRVGVIAEDASQAKVELEKIQTQAIELKTKSDETEKELASIKWGFEGHVKLTGKLKIRNGLKDKKMIHSNELHKLKTSTVTIQENIKTHEKNIELYNKHVESVKLNDEISQKIERLNHTLTQTEYAYKTKNKAILDISGKISICQNQITSITDKIAKVKQAETEYKLYEVYCNAVGNDGIPFEIITATVPEIQSEVNNILAQITDFTALFETDGKNVIPYIVFNGQKWLMGMTSGFEKFALSLAIRVALINISNLPRPNFLVLDEGFGVLDAENLASLSSLFDYLKSNFEFIMIISHLDALRDFVDKHIEITKDNGISKVSFV